MGQPEKGNHESKAMLVELAQHASDLLKKGQLFREARYAMLAAVARIRCRLNANNKCRRQIIKDIKEEKGGRSKRKLNLSAELVAIASGAASRRARQRASKWGAVIDYLLDERVEPERFRKEIIRRGGIEAIYRASIACRQETKSPLGSKENLIPDRASVSKKKVAPRLSNDGETLLSVRIKASDKDELIKKRTVGVKVKLYGLVVGNKPEDIKITKVRIGGADDHVKASATDSWIN